ncbi:MAG TPA: tetratricopeptide repeat protein [Gemmatimonadaceae bacterium]|nr:tetratricopeptide repeat protein [Gemmatimonadaceae bacterium]
MSDATSDAPDDLTSRARALAVAGEWPEVVRLLGGLATGVGGTSELQLLRAEALTRVGDARAASAWLREIIPALVSRGDRASHRRALNLLGAASFYLGRLEEASDAFAAALEMASEEDDLLIFARATNNLGMIENLRGHHESALGHYRLAVPTYQRLGQRRGLAESYHNIAITYRDIGSLSEADEYERRAIDYAAEGIAPRVAAMGMIGRAEIALRRGDPQFARGTAERAAAELERLHDPVNEADAHRLTASAEAALGRFSDAERAFDRALGIARTGGHALIEAEALRDRAHAYLKQGRRADARRDADAAMALFARLGATKEIDALREAVG